MQESEIKEDEISLKELILKLREWYKYLLSKWRSILIAGIIGGILGFTYAYFKKPVYTSEITFVLEDGESSSGVGAYAGLASMIGIDLNGGGGGIFQGDNILELYKSKRMIKETLLTSDTFNSKQDLLINRYLIFNGLRDKWKDDVFLNRIKFSSNTSQYSRNQDSILLKVIDDINTNYLEVTKPDKKLSIINVKVKSINEEFSKSLSEKIVDNVNNFYIKTKTKKSAENLAILQFQADSIKRVLAYNIAGVASAIDANPNANLAFQTLRVTSQKKQLDVQANAAAYQEILKNLEIAKISFRKEKPLIQIIDKPFFPLPKKVLSKIPYSLLGSFIFLFCTFAFLIIVESVKIEIKN